MMCGLHEGSSNIYIALGGPALRRGFHTYIAFGGHALR